MTLPVTLTLRTLSLSLFVLGIQLESLTGALFCWARWLHCHSFAEHALKARRKLYVASGSLISGATPAE